MSRNERPHGFVGHSTAACWNVTIGGLWGKRLKDSCVNWLLKVDEGLLLGGFRKRPGIQPWIGEHVGKFLLSAIGANRLLGDRKLDAKIRRLAQELPSHQEDDGYLGTYLPGHRWSPSVGGEWDVWVHKYCMLALLEYYRETGWEPALRAARRAADIVLKEFGPAGKRDINQSDPHCGLASGSVLEPVMLLYLVTRDRKYLDFGSHLVRKWEAESGPGLMRVLRKRQSVHRIGRGKAYEMMSCFVGLTEYARAAGRSDLLDLLLAARDRIADTQRYPTGGTSMDEYFRAPGELPEHAAIETCVTFTWIQWNLRLFEVAGDRRALDLAEEAAFNQLLPAVSPRADTWTYFLPITGPKRFAKKWVQGVASAGKGAPITCCHTNGQRGLALLPAYFYTVTPAGDLAVNFYGESSARVDVPGVGTVAIAQKTEYPRSGDIRLEVRPPRGATLRVLLRKPVWADGMKVGGRNAVAKDGRIEVKVRGPAVISITLDMKPRILACGFDLRGKCALAWGPLVMAMDKAPGRLRLDEAGILLKGSRPAARIRTSRRKGWPALVVPLVRMPSRSFEHMDALPGPAGTATLIPVIFAGIARNPSVNGIFAGGDPALMDRPPQYRVLFPFIS